MRTPPMRTEIDRSRQSKFVAATRIEIANRSVFWHTGSLSMNKYLSFMAGAVVLAVGVAGPVAWAATPWEPGLVARLHFAGGDAVGADPNYSSVRNVWSSPAALAMRARTLDKLDAFLDLWLRRQIAPTLGNP